MMTPGELIAVWLFLLLVLVLLGVSWYSTRDRTPKPEDPRADDIIKRIDEDE